MSVVTNDESSDKGAVLERVHAVLMHEIKNHSAQLFTGSVQLDLHFLHGKIAKIKVMEQKYIKN